MLSAMYRPRKGDTTVFENFCENLLSANNKTSKNIIFAGDLNLTNLLDYEFNKKVQPFLSSMFQYNTTSATIDHIITNTVTSDI